jgi:hypothetical protein
VQPPFSVVVTHILSLVEAESVLKCGGFLVEQISRSESCCVVKKGIRAGQPWNQPSEQNAKRARHNIANRISQETLNWGVVAKVSI